MKAWFILGFLILVGVMSVSATTIPNGYYGPIAYPNHYSLPNAYGPRGRTYYGAYQTGGYLYPWGGYGWPSYYAYPWYSSHRYAWSYPYGRGYYPWATWYPYPYHAFWYHYTWYRPWIGTAVAYYYY